MSAPYPDASASAPAATDKKVLGILALVFGIVGVVLGFFFWPIGILSAIAAVVLGFVSRRREPAARTLALVGLILGFVGIVVAIAMLVIGIAFVASYMQTM